MSRHSVLPEEGVGPGGEIVFGKHSSDYDWYNLFVGDRYFGLIVREPRYWGAISYNPEPSEFFNINYMNGFATRFTAASFIINHWGYWMH